MLLVTKEKQIKDHAIQCELFCQGKGSIKVHELETRILLMDHQHQISKLLMDEKERLIEQLQRELSEVKSERDNL